MMKMTRTVTSALCNPEQVKHPSALMVERSRKYQERSKINHLDLQQLEKKSKELLTF